MSATTLLLPVLLVVGQVGDLKDRKPHPLAPSLPLLTPAEEAKLEAIVERFIEYDIGKLKGAAGLKAKQDFERLGPEAIFVLIEGFNRAANLQSSCPAVIIGRKIAKILAASDDLGLMEFARENIGTGVTARRHMATVKDLQFGATLRRNALARRGAAAAKVGGTRGKAPARMSLAELAAAAAKETGVPLRAILAEAGRRSGTSAFDLLASHADSKDAAARKLALGLLAQQVQRQPADRLKSLLKDNRPAVRALAARSVGARRLRWGGELIELLQDPEPQVQQSARAALVALARGVDHGPAPGASFGDREAAVRNWRLWWSAQK